MTTTTTIDARLDGIETQLALLIEDSQRRVIRQAALSELVSDMAPVGREAMAGVSDWLSGTEINAAKVGRLAGAMAGSLSEIEALVRALKPLSGLVETMSELSGPALEMTTARLGEMDQRGYFQFMRSGLGVLDRIVTGFDEGDLDALGDNVVLMLETLRDMTQPDVMLMLRRTLHSVQAADAEEPPGLFGLLREMRRPEVRRGLARLVQVLDSLGTETNEDTQEVY